MRAAGGRWRRGPVLVPALVVGLVVLVVLSFWLGQFPVGPTTVARILLSRIAPIPVTWSPAADTAVVQVRLPEVLGAVLVGAALSSSGAAYQAMLRNPLVSPEILGVAAGAAFGGALAILLGAGGTVVQGAAFVGGLVAAALALGVGRLVRSGSTIVLVLSGIVVGALFEALTSGLEYFADPDSTLPQIAFWLFGSLDRVTTAGLAAPAVIVAVCLVALYAVRWPLTVLAAGEDEARALGVRRGLVWTVVIGAATLLTATVVSVAGVVGWVGLVVPHVARALVGPSFGRLLVVSTLVGAAFVVVVEDVARAASTIELPLGILTALIGAPFFVVLLVRVGRQWL